MLYTASSRLEDAPNGFASTCWLSFQSVSFIVAFSVKYVWTSSFQYDMFSRWRAVNLWLHTENKTKTHLFTVRAQRATQLK